MQRAGSGRGPLRAGELAEAVVLADLTLVLSVLSQVLLFLGGALLVIAIVPMAAIAAGVAFLITGGSLQGGLRPLVAVLVAVALAAVSYLGFEMLLRSEEVGLVLSVIRRDRSRV